jgi:hypothetical protein
MTREQIEQAAYIYSIDENNCWTSAEGGEINVDIADNVYDAFLAGAKSRQAEIDELTADLDTMRQKFINAQCRLDEMQDILMPELTSDIERYKANVIEGLERERVARKVIEDKRGEVEELTELLRWAMEYVYANAPTGSCETEINRAHILLKTHSK